MSWRFYARRQTSGAWLHTDVPMDADITWAINDGGTVQGSIPAAFDVSHTPDGLPFWLERGTTLYAEEDGELSWVGLCTYSQETRDGRDVEFAGMASAYDLIGFTGRIRRWNADPYDLVEELIANAHDQPDGDLGLEVVRRDTPADRAGDIEPPPRPRKPKRRRNETKTAFQDRLEKWGKERDAWEKEFGDREPYLLSWFDEAYIGLELRELADEIPFEFFEHHEWTDRDRLEAAHQLILRRRVGLRRHDVALISGVNLADVIDPATDYETYGNHVVALGAGEGRDMRRASVGERDGRVRTTRYMVRKHVHHKKRLRRLAGRRLRRSKFSVTIESATAFDAPGVGGSDVASIRPGDEVRVRTETFEGWARVIEKTRSTTTGLVQFTFEAAEGAS